MQNKTMEIDVIGQYYTSINTGKQSGVFALAVYLKELVNPQVLQQAFDDLMRRLPFLNGRVRRGFFHFEFERLETFAKIEPDDNEPLFSDYYNRGSRHMIRVFYGQRHFIVKTTHSICDGRGLSIFTKALIVRYFQLLGVEFSDIGDTICCCDTLSAEEWEDSHKRYATRPENAAVEKENTPAKAYHIKFRKSPAQQILSGSFDAGKIKSIAKALDVTVSEYILTHIFMAVAAHRNASGETGRIGAMIPVDCRSFFPSKTLRSFVASADVFMPETDDFTEMARGVKAQFREITKDSMLREMYEHQKMYDMARFVPRAIKALYMKVITYYEAEFVTTGLSNLGLIKLPHEIESRIERMEFPIALEPDFPQFFSSVTVGNVLTLTASFKEEARQVVETVMDGLSLVAALA